MFVPCGWRIVAEFDPLSSQTDDFASSFTMDDPAIFQTFRVQITRFVGGTCIVQLRFGFDVADTQLSAQFILFPVLGALNVSDLRSFAWALGAALPDAAGNPNSILPPHCEISVTTPVATDLTIQIQAAWVAIK